jgi:hypothetical protein
MKMAKTIISEGPKVFPGHCGYCGCDFSYEPEDVYQLRGSDYVDCPSCKRGCMHAGESGTIRQQTGARVDEVRGKN